MAAIDDPRTLGRARLTFGDEAEVEEFARTLERFERGEISAAEWRQFRLVRGTYGQRQEGDLSMVRIKIPQGVLEASQLRALALVTGEHGRGFGHFTTRQNFQLHFVRLHSVEDVMRRATEAGLTTREACGNSVRNVTCCPYAGVARDEPFDVTPYAEAITRHLLRHPLSATLPRKFKIAAEGCREDHVFAAINDLGLRARLLAGGRPGFRVTVAGGTATLAVTGHLLHGELPASEVLDVAEAVVRVYHALGDREHRNRNRLKFLVRDMGWEAWHEAYERELAQVRAAGGIPLPFDPEEAPPEDASRQSAPRERPRPPSIEAVAALVRGETLRGPGLVPRPGGGSDLRRWLETNVRPQRQAGYALVTVTLPLGDVTAAQLRVLADLSESYADGTLRVTASQNLLFRWVPRAEVHELAERLAAAGLATPGADTAADVTSCPGAESCRLAVTQSRGLGRLLGDFLQERPELVARVPGLALKVSGCPNGCGQHHVAGIGFQGSLRKLGGRAVPQYFVLVGGGVDETGARIGRLAAKVPARRVPAVLERLIGLYLEAREEGEAADAFFRRVPLERVKSTLGELERLTPEEAREEDFIDLGETEAFVPGTSEGECSS